MPTLGADISHWQSKSLTINQLWKGGVRFVICKATQYTGFVDSSFDGGDGRTYFKDAKRKGMVPGAYHWIERGNAKAQARHFVRTVRKANGGGLENVIMCLDDEANATWSDVLAFTNEYHKLTKNKPLFYYTTSSRFSRYRLNQVKGPVRLWLARWTCARQSGCKTTAKGSNTNVRGAGGYLKQRYNGKKPAIVQWTNSMYGPWPNNIDGNWSDLSPKQLAAKANVGNTGGVFPDEPDIPKPRPRPGPGQDPEDEKWQDPDDAENYTGGGVAGATLTSGFGLGAVGLAGAVLAGGAIVLVAAIGSNMKKGAEE